MNSKFLNRINKPRSGRKNLELIIEEKFGGQFTYGNMGMRHSEEEETFYLDKGDKVYIERKKKR